MPYSMYIVDAFADRPLEGNPAAVCPLSDWLPDSVMQAVAAEMNLSETVFFVREGDHYRIRWFTPTREVDLVGHATLAAAYIVLEKHRPELLDVRFTSASGPLSVRRHGNALALDLPALPPRQVDRPAGLVEALGAEVLEVWTAKHYLVLLDSAQSVRNLAPDMTKLSHLPLPAVIVTAPGGDSGYDFVSRFFAPANGVPEDPVSGVSHCSLVPFWSKRLGRDQLSGRQLSRRGGTLICEARGDRVVLSGRATLFLEGQIALPGQVSMHHPPPSK
jgi:PhzF family phenazine biosynthesis protein